MRELDEQIAKRVFGWKTWKFKNPSRIRDEMAFEFEALVPPNYDGINPVDVPMYSVDMRITHLLMDRLIERGWYFVISHKLSYPVEWVCEASNGKEKTSMKTSSSLPQAVREAILELINE